MRLSKTTKIISILICIVFTANTVCFSAPPVYTIKIPEKNGRVKERYHAQKASESQKVIIHIEDAHTSLEAQENIAAIIKELSHQIQNTEYRIQKTDTPHLSSDVCRLSSELLIGVEGAYGDIDLSGYRAFPLAEARERVAHDYLEEGHFSGSEYAAVSLENAPTFFGIEDKKLFQENFKTFYEATDEQEKTNDIVAEIERILESLKDTFFNEELRAFDQAAQKYESGALDIQSFLPTLVAQAEMGSIELETYPQCTQFIQVAGRERMIDWKRAEEEEEKLIQRLKDLKIKKIENLDGEQETTILRYLINASKTYFPGSAGKKTRATLERLLEYYSLWERIDFEALTEEITHITQEVRRRMAEKGSDPRGLTPFSTRRLVELCHTFSLLKKIITISATRKEVEQFLDTYEKNIPKEFVSKINNLSALCSLPYAPVVDITSLNTALKRARIFYADAQRRDEAFVENLLQKMDTEKKNEAVLISGGFHSSGIKEALRARGIDYLSVSPVISSAKKDLPFLEKMTGRLFPIQPELISNITALKICIENAPGLASLQFAQLSAAEMFHMIIEGGADVERIKEALGQTKDIPDAKIEKLIQDVRKIFDSFIRALANDKNLSREEIKNELTEYLAGELTDGEYKEFYDSLIALFAEFYGGTEDRHQTTGARQQREGKTTRAVRAPADEEALTSDQVEKILIKHFYPHNEYEKDWVRGMIDVEGKKYPYFFIDHELFFHGKKREGEEHLPFYFYRAGDIFVVDRSAPAVLRKTLMASKATVVFMNLCRDDTGSYGYCKQTILHLIQLQRQNLEGKVIVDAGSGNGVVSIAAALRGAQKIIVLEKDALLEERVKENARMSCADLSRFDFSQFGKKFDERIKSKDRKKKTVDLLFLNVDVWGMHKTPKQGALFFQLMQLFLCKKIISSGGMLAPGATGVTKAIEITLTNAGFFVKEEIQHTFLGSVVYKSFVAVPAKGPQSASVDDEDLEKYDVIVRKGEEQAEDELKEEWYVPSAWTIATQKALQQVSHPSLPKVKMIDETLHMKRVPGIRFQDWLAEQKETSEKNFLSLLMPWMLSVAEALKILNDEGGCHGPLGEHQLVLEDKTNHLVLIDFREQFSKFENDMSIQDKSDLEEYKELLSGILLTRVFQTPGNIFKEAENEGDVWNAACTERERRYPDLIAVCRDKDTTWDALISILRVRTNAVIQKKDIPDWKMSAQDFATPDEYIHHLVANKSPITEDDLRILDYLYFKKHAMSPTIAEEKGGLYRQGTARIRNALCLEDDVADIVKYVRRFPKQSEEELSREVNRILTLLNTNPENLDFIDLLAEVHWQFIMELHPFADFNGHTIRGIMSVFLARAGYEAFYINGDPQAEAEYYRAQSATRDEFKEYLHSVVRKKETSPATASVEEGDSEGHHKPYLSFVPEAKKWLDMVTNNEFKMPKTIFSSELVHRKDENGNLVAMPHDEIVTMLKERNASCTYLDDEEIDAVAKRIAYGQEKIIPYVLMRLQEADPNTGQRAFSLDEILSISVCGSWVFARRDMAYGDVDIQVFVNDDSFCIREIPINGEIEQIDDRPFHAVNAMLLGIDVTDAKMKNFSGFTLKHKKVPEQTEVSQYWRNIPLWGYDYEKDPNEEYNMLLVCACTMYSALHRLAHIDMFVPEEDNKRLRKVFMRTLNVLERLEFLYGEIGRENILKYKSQLHDMEEKKEFDEAYVAGVWYRVYQMLRKKIEEKTVSSSPDRWFCSKKPPQKIIMPPLVAKADAIARILDASSGPYPFAFDRQCKQFLKLVNGNKEKGYFEQIHEVSTKAFAGRPHRDGLSRSTIKKLLTQKNLTGWYDVVHFIAHETLWYYAQKMKESLPDDEDEGGYHALRVIKEGIRQAYEMLQHNEYDISRKKLLHTYIARRCSLYAHNPTVKDEDVWKRGVQDIMNWLGAEGILTSDEITWLHEKILTADPIEAIMSQALFFKEVLKRLYPEEENMYSQAIQALLQIEKEVVRTFVRKGLPNADWVHRKLTGSGAYRATRFSDNPRVVQERMVTWSNYAMYRSVAQWLRDHQYSTNRVLYPFSGGDVIAPLLMTGAQEIVFYDELPFIADESDEQVAEFKKAYFYYKEVSRYSGMLDLHAIGNAKILIKWELEALGARDIVITKGEKGTHYIDFLWSAHSSDLGTPRRIVYHERDLSAWHNDALGIIDDSYDIYFNKVSNQSPIIAAHAYPPVIISFSDVPGLDSAYQAIPLNTICTDKDAVAVVGDHYKDVYVYVRRADQSTVQSLPSEEIERQKTDIEKQEASTKKIETFLKKIVIYNRAYFITRFQQKQKKSLYDKPWYLSYHYLWGECSNAVQDITDLVKHFSDELPGATFKELQARDLFGGQHHAFGVLSYQGKQYLVDTSFIQFFNPYDEEEGRAGNIIRRHVRRYGSQWLVFAEELLRNGFIELTDEVAEMYGCAMKGTWFHDEGETITAAMFINAPEREKNQYDEKAHIAQQNEMKRIFGGDSENRFAASPDPQRIAEYVHHALDDSKMSAEEIQRATHRHSKINYGQIHKSLISDETMAYCLKLKNVVNPRNDTQTVVYGGAGVDVSTLLFATGATRGLLVSDDLYDITEEGLEEMLEDPIKYIYRYLDQGYAEWKKKRGYANHLLHLSTKEQRLAALAAEMIAGFVDMKSVTIIKRNNFLGLSFTRIDDERTYEIIFIPEDITKPEEYSDSLKELLEKGFDIYFQKASFAIPRAYLDAPNFIYYLYEHMTVGGYFMTDDWGKNPHEKITRKEMLDYGEDFPEEELGLEHIFGEEELNRPRGYGQTVTVRKKRIQVNSQKPKPPLPGAWFNNQEYITQYAWWVETFIAYAIGGVFFVSGMSQWWAAGIAMMTFWFGHLLGHVGHIGSLNLKHYAQPKEILFNKVVFYLTPLHYSTALVLYAAPSMMFCPLVLMFVFAHKKINELYADHQEAKRQESIQFLHGKSTDNEAGEEEKKGGWFCSALAARKLEIEEPERESLFFLDKLSTISFDMVNYEKNRGLPALIKQTLAADKQNRIAEKGINKISVKEIVKRIDTDLPLIDENLYCPIVDTWFGAISLRRLNNVRSYEGEQNPAAAFLRDLWIAHCAGLIEISMPTKFGFDRPKELCKKIQEKCKSRGLKLSWHEALIVLALLNDDTTIAKKYSGTAGMIRYVKYLHERGLMTTIRLPAFFSVVPSDVRADCGWKDIGLSFEEAERIRAAVLALLNSDQKDTYRYDSGQWQYFEELKKSGHISTQSIRYFYSALDDEWTRKLCWTMMTTEKIKNTVTDVAKKTRRPGQVNVVDFDDVLKKLDEKAQISNGEYYERRADAVQKEVDALIASNERKAFEGNAGQVRFVRQLMEKGIIPFSRLRPFFDIVDSESLRIMKWAKLDLSVAEAERMCQQMQDYVESGGYKTKGSFPRVVVNEKGRVIDWFYTVSIPKRLRDVNGTILGRTLSAYATLSFSFKFNLLGSAEYVFHDRARDLRSKPVEIIMREGHPYLFRVWISEQTSRAVTAAEALVMDSYGSAGFEDASRTIGTKTTATKKIPVDEENIEGKVLVREIIDMLEAQYPGQGERIAALLLKYDDLVNEENLDEDEACRTLECEYEIEPGLLGNAMEMLRDTMTDASSHYAEGGWFCSAPQKVKKRIVTPELKERRKMLKRVLDRQKKTITQETLHDLAKQEPGYDEITQQNVYYDVREDTTLRTHEHLEILPPATAKTPEVTQRKAIIKRVLDELYAQGHRHDVMRHKLLTVLHEKGYTDITYNNVVTDTLRGEGGTLKGHPALYVRKVHRPTKKEFEERRAREKTPTQWARDAGGSWEVVDIPEATQEALLNKKHPVLPQIRVTKKKKTEIFVPQGKTLEAWVEEQTAASDKEFMNTFIPWMASIIEALTVLEDCQTQHWNVDQFTIIIDEATNQPVLTSFRSKDDDIAHKDLPGIRTLLKDVLVRRAHMHTDPNEATDPDAFWTDIFEKPRRDYPQLMGLTDPSIESLNELRDRMKMVIAEKEKGGDKWFSLPAGAHRNEEDMRLSFNPLLEKYVTSVEQRCIDENMAIMNDNGHMLKTFVRSKKEGTLFTVQVVGELSTDNRFNARHRKIIQKLGLGAQKKDDISFDLYNELDDFLSVMKSNDQVKHTVLLVSEDEYPRLFSHVQQWDLDTTLRILPLDTKNAVSFNAFLSVMIGLFELMRTGNDKNTTFLNTVFVNPFSARLDINVAGLDEKMSEALKEAGRRSLVRAAA